MIVDDLLWRFFVAGFVFSYVKEIVPSKGLKRVFFVNICLLKRCSRNRRGKKQKVSLCLLRTAKLEIVFQRAWLIMIVPPNWIIIILVAIYFMKISSTGIELPFQCHD